MIRLQNIINPKILIQTLIKKQKFITRIIDHPHMFKHKQKEQLSENNDCSLGQTLTKFNLTNYKSKQKYFNVRNQKKMDFLKQINDIKEKQRPELKIIVNKSKQELATFKTMDIQMALKKRKKRSASQMKIQVTSRSEKSLIQYMNPQNLPKILIKNRLKRSPVQKLISIVNDEDKFRKYTQTYFNSLQKTKKKLEGKQVSQQFPRVSVLGWSVKGYVINDNLILKASKKEKKGNNIFNTKKIEKYKKYNYVDSVKEKVHSDFKSFVTSWLYLDEVALKK